MWATAKRPGMRNFGFWVLLAGAGWLASGADWPMPSGGPQRNGWARSERMLTKENIKSLKLLYKYQADNVARGTNSLTPPIINGNLITYKGFKEMLMFGASADKVFSVDADLNKLIWESKMPYKGDTPASTSATATCPGGLTAPIAMAGSSSSPMHFAAEASRLPAVAGAPRKRPSPYLPTLAQSVYPMTAKTLSQLAAVYAVSSDGYLHVLNSSTGEDLIAPIKFLPPNAKVTSLNVWETMVYATTGGLCDGYRNALYGLNLLTNEKKVVVFAPEFGGFAGSGGTAIGFDGTVYVQTMQAPGEPAGRFHDTVLALTPRELTVKDYFTVASGSLSAQDRESTGITPAVFTWRGKEMIAAGGRNGRLYLLDAKSLGGADHKTPLLQTPPVIRRARGGEGFQGSFASWQDIDTQTRWLYVPVAGPVKTGVKFPNMGNAPTTGSLLAFALKQEGDKPTLDPLWLSGDMVSPGPATIVNGMVFALSTGTVPSGTGDPKAQAAGGPAVLYALDALTGKQLYTSGTSVTAPAANNAIAVANGRIYFSAQDNSVYSFGLAKDQTQLTEQ